MAGVDPESGKGAGGVEEDDEDPYQVGVNVAGVRLILHILCSVGVAIRCRDVGGYPPHGTVPRWIPVPSGTETDGSAPPLAG